MAARLLSERRGPVLVLTLSNPQARNALHPDIYAAGLEAATAAASDPDIGAIVLTGEGTTFCAGGNLQRLREARGKPRDAQRASIEGLHAWVRALHACPQPVVAAVEGAAAGAGFSLVLASDLVVAAEDAKFVMAYTKVGLTPDGGATLALLERMPYPLAYELLATAAPIGAARLHALGVVNRVVAPGGAREEALAWAAKLADGPRAALGRVKTLLHRRDAAVRDAQLDAERDSFVDSLFGPEAGEGIDAFLDKRAPRFGSARDDRSAE